MCSEHFFVTGHCLWWKRTQRAEQRAVEGTVRNTPMKPFRGSPPEPQRALWYVRLLRKKSISPRLAGEPKLQPTLQGPARNHPALSNMLFFTGIYFHSLCSQCSLDSPAVWVLPFTAHCPVSPPAPEECELCLSSLEPWSLARREEQVSAFQSTFK